MLFLLMVSVLSRYSAEYLPVERCSGKALTHNGRKALLSAVRVRNRPVRSVLVILGVDDHACSSWDTHG
jgi:hypothetical protein